MVLHTYSKYFVIKGAIENSFDDMLQPGRIKGLNEGLIHVIAGSLSGGTPNPPDK